MTIATSERTPSVATPARSLCVLRVLGGGKTLSQQELAKDCPLGILKQHDRLAVDNRAIGDHRQRFSKR